MSDLNLKVTKIVCEQLGLKEDEIKSSDSFIDDLNADSLDTVELVMALEEEFDAEIPDEDAEKLTSVDLVVKYIEENGFKQ
jgi:acyl carrier protein